MAVILNGKKIKSKIKHSGRYARFTKKLAKKLKWETKN
jgi:hypothetical protein